MKAAQPLLDRHAFRQVARLIHVGAPLYGHVIGEKLQRNRMQLAASAMELAVGTSRTASAMRPQLGVRPIASPR